MRRDQIALQLYTVRGETANDFLGTLRRVAEMGYPAVEFAGFGDLSIGQLKAEIDAIGLKAPSAHIQYGLFIADPAKTANEMKALGAEYATVPFIGEEERRTLDEARQFVANLNVLGRACKEAGIGFAYHNHAFEFAPLPGATDGTRLWDLLLNETDPDLVSLELDIYWAMAGGDDPLAIIHNHAKRFPLLHVKDMTAGDPPRDAPVGEGIVDWAPILAATETTAKWYIVEQDHPNDPLTDVETSLRALQGMAS